MSKGLDQQEVAGPWCCYPLEDARVGLLSANQITLNTIRRVVLRSTPVEWIVDLLEVITNAHVVGCCREEMQPLKKAEPENVKLWSWPPGNERQHRVRLDDREFTVDQWLTAGPTASLPAVLAIKILPMLVIQYPKTSITLLCYLYFNQSSFIMSLLTNLSNSHLNNVFNCEVYLSWLKHFNKVIVFIKDIRTEIIGSIIWVISL